MLAHGSVLREKFYSPAQLTTIAADSARADLTPAEVAMMAFAERVARDAAAITDGEVGALREHGFTDAQIFDIAAAAAARCFFSKLVDALGAQPDEAYGQLEKDLLRALALDPRHARALHMEGMILYKTPAALRVFLEGKKSDVERYLTSAIKADPSFAPARLDLAEYYLEEKRPADARAQAKAVLDLKAPRAQRYKPEAEALLRRIPAS